MRAIVTARSLCCNREIKARVFCPGFNSITHHEEPLTCNHCKRTGDTLLIESKWIVDKEEIRGEHKFSWKLGSPITMKGFR